MMESCSYCVHNKKKLPEFSWSLLTLSIIQSLLDKSRNMEKLSSFVTLNIFLLQER